jgi:hypothetical protein
VMASEGLTEIPLDRAVAVVGSTVVIGCTTGRVLVMRFNPDGPRPSTAI